MSLLSVDERTQGRKANTILMNNDPRIFLLDDQVFSDHKGMFPHFLLRFYFADLVKYSLCHQAYDLVSDFCLK